MTCVDPGCGRGSYSPYSTLGLSSKIFWATTGSRSPLSQGAQRIELDRHVLVPVVGANHEHACASLPCNVPDVIEV